MTGLTTAVLVAVGDMLPPVARLSVYPMWKVELMANNGQLTVGELRVLTKLQREAERVGARR